MRGEGVVIMVVGVMVIGVHVGFEFAKLLVEGILETAGETRGLIAREVRALATTATRSAAPGPASFVALFIGRISANTGPRGFIAREVRALVTTAVRAAARGPATFVATCVGRISANIGPEIIAREVRALFTTATRSAARGPASFVALFVGGISANIGAGFGIGGDKNTLVDTEHSLGGVARRVRGYEEREGDGREDRKQFHGCV